MRRSKASGTSDHGPTGRGSLYLAGLYHRTEGYTLGVHIRLVKEVQVLKKDVPIALSNWNMTKGCPAEVG